MVTKASSTQGSEWMAPCPGYTSQRSLELPAPIKIFFVLPSSPAGTNDSLLRLILATESERPMGRAYGRANEASKTAAPGTRSHEARPPPS